LVVDYTINQFRLAPIVLNPNPATVVPLTPAFCPRTESPDDSTSKNGRLVKIIVPVVVVGFLLLLGSVLAIRFCLRRRARRRNILEVHQPSPPVTNIPTTDIVPSQPSTSPPHASQDSFPLNNLPATLSDDSLPSSHTRVG